MDVILQVKCGIYYRYISILITLAFWYLLSAFFCGVGGLQFASLIKLNPLKDSCLCFVCIFSISVDFYHPAFLLPGKYVMVMGVIQACSPEPCLQAVKMTDLSDNPLHESLWELEVEDLHRHIYSLDDVGTGD